MVIMDKANGFSNHFKHLHITFVYAHRPLGGSGYEKPQSGLRPLCDFSPPHFTRPGLCYAPIRAGKTSYTTGTLCEKNNIGGGIAATEWGKNIRLTKFSLFDRLFS
jgi:hypothetical protein